MEEIYLERLLFTQHQANYNLDFTQLWQITQKIQFKGSQMANDFTLLLIESNIELQSSITDILNNEFNVEHIITAKSSEQALRYLTDDTPVDCIIANSQLEDSSGFDLITNIKSIERYSGTSVLVMSERQDRAHLLQAAACGATDIIINPFSPRALILKLKKLITGQEFRVNKRVATFQAIPLTLNFGNTKKYKAKLADISVSGCSLLSELFYNGGCVYDIAEIAFTDIVEPFSIPAELIRTERDPECEDSKHKELLAAFQFNNFTTLQHHQIQNFIAKLKEL